MVGGGSMLPEGFVEDLDDDDDDFRGRKMVRAGGRGVVD